MAYQQYVKYNDIGIAVNGVEIFTGSVKAPLVNDTIKNWMSSHLYGSDSLIYIRDEPTINPNFANLEVAYSETSDQIKGNWIADRLQDNGDYIEYYNTVVGDICKIRITRTGGTSTYIDAKFSIIYLGRTITENSARTIWQLDSGTTCVIMLMPLLDVDARLATFFVGFRTASFPAHWRDNWNIDHRPVFYQTDYTNGVAQAIYTIFRGYDSGGGGGGDNPYEGAGLNDEPAGGEDQNFEETSDTIAEPTLPSSPATGSGFITAYVPTLGEINDVADYLIDPSVLQALAGTVLKLSDVVIGLSIFPFTIPATGSEEVKLNLMGIHLTTGVTCHYSDNQFVNINMGSIEVKKYWDNCLDFDPYTKISIYLPYVGYVELDTDEVMGKEITVKYNVDIVTGCCLALIIVGGSVLYQYPGECSCQIPVTSVSFDSFLQSAVQLGITAASGARAVKGAAASVSEAGVLAAEGMADTRDALSDYNSARASFSGIKANVGDSLLSASVSAVVNAKGQYSHAGAMSSCAGILGTQKPFLIIKRPKQCMPEGYESIRGFPCNMKAKLSDLEGYTEVGDIHLNIPNATVQEIVECEQFLKEGVFL